MGEIVVHKTRDRVSVSYDRKINMGNYESLGISCGYTTDVGKDETVEKAFARAEKMASHQLESLADPIETQLMNKKGRK